MTEIVIAHSGATDFPKLSRGDFLTDSVGILPESDGIHNLAKGG